MKTKSLIEHAEQRLREHLKSNRDDDEESAMLAVKISLIKDFGPNIAPLILDDPSWPERIENIRCELNPSLYPNFY